MTISFYEKHSSTFVPMSVEAAPYPGDQWVDITPFDMAHHVDGRWNRVVAVFSTNSEKCRFRFRAKSSSDAPVGYTCVDDFTLIGDMGCEPKIKLYCNSQEFRVNSPVDISLKITPGNLIGEEYLLTCGLISSGGISAYYPDWSALPSFMSVDFAQKEPLMLPIVNTVISDLDQAMSLQGFWLAEVVLYDLSGEVVCGPARKGFSIVPQFDLHPYASLGASPMIAAVDEPVIFDASASFDDITPMDGLRFRWDFDADGLWDSDYGQSPIMEMRFPYSGGFEVAVEVIDGAGQTDAAKQGVYVY